MGQRTKIDWADSTWNPVTGCQHGCKYCYARRMAERFGGVCVLGKGNAFGDLDEPYKRQDNGRINPYPYGFLPTFHRYRLNKPQEWKEARNIFVCSMADLFGEWVPDEWITEVFKACEAVPQHRYLFLTKNPERYLEWGEEGMLPKGENMWYGSTTVDPSVNYFHSNEHHCFLSIEPMMEEFGDDGCMAEGIDWVIIGRETGNRKGKVIPQKKWIMDIAEICGRKGIPLFMKDSLRNLMGNDFRQEFPWEDS